VPVDPEQGRAILATRDFVRRPQFIDESPGLAHGVPAAVPHRCGLVEAPQYCMLKNTK
jgi:hypothetical protein